MREKHIKVYMLMSVYERERDKCQWASHSWWLSITSHLSVRVRVRMSFTKSQQKLLVAQQQSSPSIRMIFKLSTLAFLLLCCYTSVSTFFTVGKVQIPDGCARACPPQRDPSRYICARNIATGRLGMFDGECYFGRYNHCVNVRQRKFLIWKLSN